jgi:hypothetical protein
MTIGFKTEQERAALQLTVLRTALELAWTARNGTGKEARRALAKHMQFIHQLTETPDLKGTELSKIMEVAGL